MYMIEYKNEFVWFCFEYYLIWVFNLINFEVIIFVNYIIFKNLYRLIYFFD